MKCEKLERLYDAGLRRGYVSYQILVDLLNYYEVSGEKREEYLERLTKAGIEILNI